MDSRVYFVPVGDGASAREQARAVAALWEAAGMGRLMARRDLVAIKFHVGEKGNTTHVRPELIRELVRRTKACGAFPFLTETSTLYKGQRDNAVKHILLAHGHGFSIERVGAPFIMADGLMGTSEAQVPVQGEIYRTVRVAREVLASDALLVVSHLTGHVGTGMGGCIKNLGMGLASRTGKMRQHSALRPEIIAQRCRLCGKCRRFCPEGAIGEGDGACYIVGDKCIGCGECLAVCRFDAVRFDWDIESADLQMRMAEHAKGVLAGKAGKCFHLNVLVDMTRNCDCDGAPQEKIAPDIGILGSEDPVAVDAASLELTRQQGGAHISQLSHPHLDPTIQLRHAEKIGLGTMGYTMETVAPLPRM